MNASDIDAIRARMAGSTCRVEMVDLGAERVVVKGQRPPRSAWRARALNAFAGSLGIALLRAVPAHGGGRGQEVEVERLRSLHAAGVRVPEVLHVDDRFIVVSHFAGPSLVSLIERGGAVGFEAWRRGLAALTDTHARGACLSHAFARNFIATDDGLAMIDFEDDPLEALPLDAAQARDWIAYLHSTLWLLDRSAAETQAAVAVRLADEAPPVRALVEAVGRRLTVLRHLPRSRRLWGREVIGARALGHLFPLPHLGTTSISGTI